MLSAARFEWNDLEMTQREMRTVSAYLMAFEGCIEFWGNSLPYERKVPYLQVVLGLSERITARGIDQIHGKWACSKVINIYEIKIFLATVIFVNSNNN